VTENSEKGYSDIEKLIIELENIFWGDTRVSSHLFYEAGH